MIIRRATITKNSFFRAFCLTMLIVASGCDPFRTSSGGSAPAQPASQDTTRPDITHSARRNGHLGRNWTHRSGSPSPNP